MSVAEDYMERLGAWSDIRGHLEFMYKTVIGYRRPRVIELGVRTGVSTCALLAGAIEVQGKLWSVDVDEPRVPESWLAEPDWTFIRGDDLTGPVIDALPRRCQVLFVDTLHDFDHVLAELAVYMPRLTRDGVALVHDTEWDVGDRQLEGPTGPVARALDDYCARHELTWGNRPGSYGMGVIRPGIYPAGQTRPWG